MNYVLICTTSSSDHLSQAVSQAGFTPLVGQNVYEIASLATENYPVAILVDLTTDTEEGLTNLEGLQNYPSTAYQTRLALTPPDGDLMQKALEQGATEIITTPIHIVELQARLRMAMALQHQSKTPSGSGDAIITEDRLMGILPVMEHDFRSPTAIALSSLDLLTEILSDDPETPAEIFELVNNTLVALNRQLFLVQDLVDWIRLTARQFDLGHGSIDIQQAIEEGIQHGAMLAESNGVGLELHIEDNLPAPVGNMTLFKRVINAAIDTAIKFCLRGQTITVKAERADDGIVVLLSDDGKPIMDQYRNNALFGLERQGEARHIGSRSTVGVGLPFCYAAITAMRGTIDFISDDDAKLTHLRIWLPL